VASEGLDISCQSAIVWQVKILEVEREFEFSMALKMII
jgi:hypothetical protein